jgi:small-conductance mechanosensitive channel
VTARWIHPETAQPTRRLLTALLWLFAIVMAYPYLPGSQTEAFKGVSVFLGLILTLGSSGVVNQIMSGFMITYSRALRLGDFVRAGDVEGTVMHLGVLSTKIRTVFSEEVTVPNAVIIGQTITDYSRLGRRTACSRRRR